MDDASLQQESSAAPAAPSSQPPVAQDAGEAAVSSAPLVEQSSRHIRLPIMLATLFSGGMIAFVFLYLQGMVVLTGRVIGNEAVGESGSVNATTSPGTVAMSLSAEVLVAQADRAFRDADLPEAQRLYEEALAQGADASVLRNVFDIAVLRNDKSKAESVLGLLKFQGLPDESLEVLRGFLELRTGTRERAREIFLTRASQPEYAFGLAIIAILDRDDAQAREHLARVLQSSDPLLSRSARALQGAYDEFSLFQDGKDTHLRTLLARGLIQSNRCPEAITLLSSVTGEDSAYRDAWISLFYCRYLLGENEAALTAIQRAYQLSPGRAETQYFLGLALERLGDFEQARTFLSFAVENGLQDGVVRVSDVRRHIARLSRQAGAYDEAINQLKKVLDQSTDAAEKLPVYDDLVTICIDDLHDPAQAALFASQAREDLGEQAAVFDLLGRAAFTQGNLEEAGVHFADAIRADAAFAPAFLHRCLLLREQREPVAALESCQEAYTLALSRSEGDIAAEAARSYNELVQSIGGQ